MRNSSHAPHEIVHAALNSGHESNVYECLILSKEGNIEPQFLAFCVTDVLTGTEYESSARNGRNIIKIQ